MLSKSLFINKLTHNSLILQTFYVIRLTLPIY